MSKTLKRPEYEAEAIDVTLGRLKAARAIFEKSRTQARWKWVPRWPPHKE
jgi:hypothetical protein